LSGYARVVSLIGMPGGGKSTVGRLLAGRLDIPFADVDHAIQERAGMSVSELFSQRGEAAFRELESEVLQSLIAAGPSVIATGGGTVLKPENRSLLKERTLAVYLEASLPELWRRVRRNSRRPLLQVADPQAKLAELYAMRHPIYREVAAVIVTTGAPTIAQVVDAIVAELPA